jgi:hypothetical protein
MEIINPLDIFNQQWVLFEHILVHQSGYLYSTKTRRRLKGNIGNHGYVIIDINKKKWLLHRIMALCFLRDIPNEQVNHKDGNKLNNNALNLEWVSRSENVKHAWRSIPRKLQALPDMKCLATRTMSPFFNFYSDALISAYGHVVYNWKTRGYKHLPHVSLNEIKGEKHEF